MDNNAQVPNVLTNTRFGRMLVNRHDLLIGRSLCRYGEYSWQEVTVLEQLIHPNTNVVEAGSNIGSHTIPLSQRVTGSGQLYAFEPQRLVYQLLLANIALNQCHNVHAFWACAGAKPGKISIPDLPHFEVRDFGAVEAIKQVKGTRSKDLLDISCMTVDSFGLETCSLIKANVEGMELDVIHGAQRTIHKCRPSLYINAGRRNKLPPLIKKLRNLNYDLWWHVPGLFNPENVFHEQENIFGDGVSCNLLGLPAEKNIPVNGLRSVSNENDWYT